MEREREPFILREWLIFELCSGEVNVQASESARMVSSPDCERTGYRNPAWQMLWSVSLHIVSQFRAERAVCDWVFIMGSCCGVCCFCWQKIFLQYCFHSVIWTALLMTSESLH